VLEALSKGGSWSFLTKGVEGGELCEGLVCNLKPRMPSSIGTRAGVFGRSMGFSVTFLLLVIRLESSLLPGVVGSW
jgi:hypothetical protein